MLIVETLILFFGLCAYSTTAIYDQHKQLIDAKQNCQASTIQINEQK